MSADHTDDLNTIRRLSVVNVPSLEAISSAIPDVSRYFCLFLGINAISLDNSQIRKAAKALLGRGVVYLCAWGNDCERVHDQFDLEREPRESIERVIMTTWHDDESLSEALWFFANCAEPAEGFLEECKDWVAVCLNDSEIENQMRIDLIDRRVVDQDAPPIDEADL